MNLNQIGRKHEWLPLRGEDHLQEILEQGRYCQRGNQRRLLGTVAQRTVGEPLDQKTDPDAEYD